MVEGKLPPQAIDIEEVFLVHYLLRVISSMMLKRYYQMKRFTMKRIKQYIRPCDPLIEKMGILIY